MSSSLSLPMLAQASQSAERKKEAIDGCTVMAQFNDLDEMRERPSSRDLAEMSKPLRRSRMPKKAFTPTPSMGSTFLVSRKELAPLQQSSTPIPRGLYGRKLKRKLVHPLEEQRAFFDVWPANNKVSVALNTTAGSTASNTFGSTLGSQGGGAESVFSRPQLLLDMEDVVRSQLQKLASKYPSFATDVNAPPEDVLADALLSHEIATKAKMRASRHGDESRALTTLPDRDTEDGAVAYNSPFAICAGPAQRAAQFSSVCSEEDAFRVARLRVFSAAAKDFADQFKSYRRLLLWIMHEFDSFAKYCHNNVWSPDARENFKQLARDEAAAQFASERAGLMDKLSDASEHIAQLQEKYDDLAAQSSTARIALLEKDRHLKEVERDLVDANEGRTALLSRIDRLEKELWQQRNVLEGPEKQIAELSKTVSQQHEQLQRAIVTYDEACREKVILKARIERLEDSIRDKKKQNPQSVLKTEMLAFKKREVELMEQNAVLMSRIAKLEQKEQQAHEALIALKAERITTPRPQWSNHEDIFPTAASSAQRVNMAAQAMRNMMDAKEDAVTELAELKEMVGALPRGDTAEGCEDVVAEMLAPVFIKKGLETDVASYLKGVGLVKNLKLSRDTVQGLARLIWLEREQSRLSTPLDQFFSKFCNKYAPEDCEADVFAYSLYHALEWYAYDPFVGFTKKYIREEVDQLVFVDMQTTVKMFKQQFTAALQDTDPPTQIISKPEAIGIVMENAGPREEEETKRLILALTKDCPGRDVDVTTLFGWNAGEQRFSFFLEELYAQYLDDRAVFLKQLSDAVLACQPDENFQLCPPDVSYQLWRVDPEIPAQVMDDLMATLFEQPVDALFPAVRTDTGVKHCGVNGERYYGCDTSVLSEVPFVLERLRRCVVKRFCRKSMVSSILEKRDRIAAARGGQTPPNEEE